MKVSVCIATYRRPQLAATLASIAKQRLPANVELEISLADNDPNGSARAIADEFQCHHPITLRYQIQPHKNISLTRNVSVSNAHGDWLAFIDDDEIAHSDWIAQLLYCQAKYQANAVVGRVLTQYPEHTPSWIIAGDLLGKSLPATGQLMSIGITSNALIKRKLLGSRPFRPEFGISGGEDSALFHGLYRAGVKIVACQEAIVTEQVEPDRVNLPYLLRRATGIGETYARNFLLTHSRIERSTFLACALLKAGLDGLVALLLRPLGRHLSYRYLIKLHQQRGKIRFLLGHNQTELYR